MKGIEFPLLDFSLLIFTLHKRIFNRVFFFIQLSKFKERLKFQLIRTTPFLQFEKIRLNVLKFYDKTGLLLMP